MRQPLWDPVLLTYCHMSLKTQQEQNAKSIFPHLFIHPSHTGEMPNICQTRDTNGQSLSHFGKSAHLEGQEG